MFLNALIERNRALADFAAVAVRNGSVPPGTFLIDLEAVERNARLIAEAAASHDIALYAMSKQVGRNPEVIRVVSRSIPKWVAVDLTDAMAIRRAGAEVGHLGHLVQPGRSQLATVLELRPEVVTAFSRDLADGLSAVGAVHGRSQGILARIDGSRDGTYPGQEGGIALKELSAFARHVESLPNISLVGTTGYPCLIIRGDHLEVSPNGRSVLEAAQLLPNVNQINGPGHTCVEAMPLLANLGFTHAEPGHGLTGTTPMHATRADLPEQVAVAFATEVSHRLGDDSVAVIGGGFYARSGAENAIVYSARGEVPGRLTPHPSSSIDYYRTLLVDRHVRPGDPVVFAFRFQMFVTRAAIATVAGLPDRPRVVGLHDPVGHRVP